MDEVAAPGRSRSRWLTPSVIGVGLASFLSDVGHEAATAALPALLVVLGTQPAALGIIEGVSDGLSSLAKLAGGWWADRPTLRKPIAVAGYLATGVATGAFGLATRWWHVLLARSVGWFARGVRGPARDAMLADSVPREALGRAFGLERTADTVGAIVGPALAAALLAIAPLRHVFAYALVPGLLAGVAFLALVKPQQATAHVPTRFWHSLRSLPRRYRGFLVAVFLFGLGDFARTLIILRATQLLDPALGPASAAATAIALYVVHNIVYAAASYPVGAVADRMRPDRLLVIGYLAGTVTALLAALATPSLGMLAAVFIAGGVTLSFEDTLERTVAAMEVPPALRGSGFGALAAVNGVGDLLSSAVVGIAWSAVGAPVGFTIAAALCAAGATLLWVHSRRYVGAL